MGLNAMLNSVVPLKGTCENVTNSTVVSGMLYNDPSGKCLASV